MSRIMRVRSSLMGHLHRKVRWRNSERTQRGTSRGRARSLRRAASMSQRDSTLPRQRFSSTPITRTCIALRLVLPLQHIGYHASLSSESGLSSLALSASERWLQPRYTAPLRSVFIIRAHPAAVRGEALPTRLPLERIGRLGGGHEAVGVLPQQQALADEV